MISDNPLHEVYWIFRSWLWGDPLFETCEQWRQPYTQDPQPEIHQPHRARVYKCWEFLRPLFASRGYTLYENTSNRANMINPPKRSHSILEQAYPYSRRFSEKLEDAAFIVPSCSLLWAAIDAQGRDVVIKVSPEDELKVLQYLNTEEARSDPRNHTIRLIECINFKGLNFAIMPRWDTTFHHDFGTIAELMQCGKILLEAMDFLHEKRVFHGDFMAQNVGMNVVLGLPRVAPPGVRDISKTRYAVYDFDGSKIYPLETPLEDIWETQYAGLQIRGHVRMDGPYHPFPLDVLAMGLVLQTRIRHVENIIPELGPFFDAMVDRDETKRFTARQALIEFDKIYSKLSDEQLAHVLKTRTWKKGGKISYIQPRGQ